MALREHLEHFQAQTQGADSAGNAREKIREIRSRSEFMTKGEDPITKFIKKVRTEILSFLEKIWNAVINALFGGNSGTSWVFRVLVMAGVVGGGRYRDQND